MTTIFKVNNLSINNGDNKKLLKGINFELREGEMVLLEGENGIGKSTLLNSIFKHPNYKIITGHINYVVNDVYKDITNISTFEMARLGIFLSIQDIPEIEGVSTIKMLYNSYQNIHNNKSKDIIQFRNEIFKIADDFQIDKELLNRNLNDKLSGGEKKQIAMLYILALMPNIIFMDEPDSGVDKESLSKIYKIINYLKSEGKTILLISHNNNHGLNIDRKYKLIEKGDNVVIKEIKIDKDNNKSINKEEQRKTEILNDISSSDMMN